VHTRPLAHCHYHRQPRSRLPLLPPHAA
jgi:hypothetical protein